MSESEKRFIIWDKRDAMGVGSTGHPRRDDDGNIISDGIVGRVGFANAYMTIYPELPEGAKPPNALEVGECIEGVKYSVSGSRGVYDIYRVA